MTKYRYSSRFWLLKTVELVMIMVLWLALLNLLDVGGIGSSNSSVATPVDDIPVFVVQEGDSSFSMDTVDHPLQQFDFVGTTELGSYLYNVNGSQIEVFLPASALDIASDLSWVHVYDQDQLNVTASPTEDCSSGICVSPGNSAVIVSEGVGDVANRVSFVINHAGSAITESNVATYVDFIESFNSFEEIQ